MPHWFYDDNGRRVPQEEWSLAEREQVASLDRREAVVNFFVTIGKVFLFLVFLGLSEAALAGRDAMDYAKKRQKRSRKRRRR